MLDYLRQFNFLSVVVRLLLAMASGFAVGIGRARKKRNAGLRTYTLVSIGAALAMIISMYEYEMLCTQWEWVTRIAELKFDGTRYAAQIISGVGWIAAGTILASSHQQVSGLTTAIGLFSAAALGLAAGAGFYEVIFCGVILLITAMELMHPVEITYKRRLRNITISVEFSSMDDLHRISETVTGTGAKIFDIDLERTERSGNKFPAAIYTMRLSREHASHSAMLSSIAELPCVIAVRELIS